jgi:nucleoside-diphosphate-sugar epimerase
MNADFNPVLVTGASGFVGACAVRELLARGHDVHVLLRAKSQPWRLADVRERLTIHSADLNDAESIRETLLAVRPQAVLHLATHGAYESQTDARAILQTNVLGTYNLLEASIAAGVRILVNAGSSSEYGFQPEPMKETDRLQPNSFYAVAKAAQTHLCTLLAAKSDMGIVTFRLFSVYGPWEEPTRLAPTVIRRARAGLPLEMVSPDTARDFVYVDDVVEALLDWPRLSGCSGEVFNLGTGIETTLRTFVAKVTGILGSKSKVLWGKMDARQWDSNHWAADVTHVRQSLGWAPRHSLSDGLRKMAAWMQFAGDDYGPRQRRAG